MTDQPMMPEPCDHHWIHYGQPSHSPIRWIVKCSQCNQFRVEDLQEQVNAIEAAAEQRGNLDGWDEALELLENNSEIDQDAVDHYKSLNPIRINRADQEGAQGE